MSGFDWVVLIGTISFIVGYGSWVTSKRKSLDSFLIGNREARWWTVGLSVMATQASAITFLSTPGQAYHDGLGFVQFYFGLPIAMLIICLVFIPIYSKLKVYTAYEYLEGRFDYKTRVLASILFLIQRGLGAGITIYAPAIVLSTVLGWNLNLLILIIGSLVILYTIIGGTKAVNVTQKIQMGIIFFGMFFAFFTILNSLPSDYGLVESLHIAGASDKMNILDFSFDLDNRYTVWSGIIGGTFLMLSYFGTDQSQVQRYLSAKNTKESQIGLIFNGLLKVPMQFFILLTGVMVFVFYQFNASPAFFNPEVIEKIEASRYNTQFQTYNSQLASIHDNKQKLLSTANLENPEFKTAYSSLVFQEKEIRESVKAMIKTAFPEEESNDKDYVFIHFILSTFPKGLIGLLLAVFLCAAMSSTASELNALATTSLVDIYKRGINSDGSEAHYLNASRIFTAMWGIIAILFATYGKLFDNLIQFVNIVGSLFYGTILGIFVVGFGMKSINGKSVFTAAVISEIMILSIWYWDLIDISYLWLNLLGCIFVTVLAWIFSKIWK